MILVTMRCKNVIFSSSVTTSQNMKQHWLFSSCSKQVVKNQQSIKQERRFASKRLQVVSLLQLYSTTIVPQLKKAHGPQPHKHRKFSNNIIEFLTKNSNEPVRYVCLQGSTKVRQRTNYSPYRVWAFGKAYCFEPCLLLWEEIVPVGQLSNYMLFETIL